MGRQSREIHLNVNRSRISILGFTLSLVVFAIGILMSIKGEHVPAYAQWYKPVVATALLVGLSLCLLSLWLCLISQKLASEAVSGLRRFLFAELLMYLSLSQVLSAMSQIFYLGMNLRLTQLEQTLVEKPERLQLMVSAESDLTTALFVMGTITWILMTYIAPLLAIQRAALRKGEWMGIVALYALVVLFTFYVNTLAYRVKFLGLAQDSTLDRLFLRQFIQPLLWG